MIKTTIKGNTISFTWESATCLTGHKLTIKHDEDVSDTPRHLANFTFGMVMLDAFLWWKHPIVFDELTLPEKTALEKCLLMSHKSRGCCGLIYDVQDPKINAEPPTVYVEKIVDGEGYEGGGPVMVSNGLGKDALLSMCMLREAGYDVRGFIVGRHTPSEETWAERIENIDGFYELKGVSSSVIYTNFFQLRPYTYHKNRICNIGFYPYFFSFPLAYKHHAEAVLAGVEIHNSKTHVETNASPCVPESVFIEKYVENAFIPFSSINRAVTEYGSQRVFSERYPEVADFQRSCDLGLPYCNRCTKCARTAMNLRAVGLNSQEIGLKEYAQGYLKTLNQRGLTPNYHRHFEADYNVEKMLFGEPYLEWVAGASSKAFDLMWHGDEFKKIFAEHVDFYDYDPGPDRGGYTLTPSKWKHWIENDFVSFIR